MDTENALLQEWKALFVQDEIPDEEMLAQWLFPKIREQMPPFAPKLLSGLLEVLTLYKGIQSSLNLLARMEVALGFRKPRLGIYDNAFHFIGGAQKYGCTIANALQNRFDITLIANADISIEQLQNWYDLDLQQCQIKTIKIPYFESQKQKKEVFDAGLVDLKKENPFHVISRESGLYDIFVNNCMLEMVYPLAPVSELVCHFPEREISRFFHVGNYSHIIYNSQYTAFWIKQRWRLDPHIHIYPPVDMESAFAPENKEKTILSVSRFELSGNKQQLEMIKAFVHLIRTYPEVMRDWQLLLVGGSVKNNPYLDRIKSLLSAYAYPNIKLMVNIPAQELKSVYQKASIFWHFCGLNQLDPARIEHFGMTTAEAMQNGCVPIVFDGGGQPEIVEEGVSGLLFKTQAEAFEKTALLLKDKDRMQRLGQGAHTRGKDFTKQVFISKIQSHFTHVLQNYSLQPKS